MGRQTSALFAREIYPAQPERNRTSGPVSVGATDSFEQLVNRFAPRLRTVSFAILGNDLLAEEACVRVFARAYRTLAISPSPWLDLVQSIITQCHRLRRRPFFDWRIPTSSRVNADVGPKQREAIRLLQRLPWDQRLLLVLREVAELSPDQIGTILGSSVAYVKYYLLAARQALLKTTRA